MQEQEEGSRVEPMIIFVLRSSILTNIHHREGRAKVVFIKTERWMNPLASHSVEVSRDVKVGSANTVQTISS
jgi:hypothetical protein